MVFKRFYARKKKKKRNSSSFSFLRVSSLNEAVIKSDEKNAMLSIPWATKIQRTCPFQPEAHRSMMGSKVILVPRRKAGLGRQAHFIGHMTTLFPDNKRLFVNADNLL